jgi:hypothetical protein
MGSRQRERQGRPETSQRALLAPSKQENASRDSDYADEHDGEHPPFERTFPEMTGRTGDLGR